MAPVTSTLMGNGVYPNLGVYSNRHFYVLAMLSPPGRNLLHRTMCSIRDANNDDEWEPRFVAAVQEIFEQWGAKEAHTADISFLYDEIFLVEYISGIGGASIPTTWVPHVDRDFEVIGLSAQGAQPEDVQALFPGGRFVQQGTVIPVWLPGISG